MSSRGEGEKKRRTLRSKVKRSGLDLGFRQWSRSRTLLNIARSTHRIRILSRNVRHGSVFIRDGRGRGVGERSDDLTFLDRRIGFGGGADRDATFRLAADWRDHKALE